MNQEETVYKILLVSGIKEAKARQLAEIVSAVYSQYPRPDDIEVKKKMDAIAEQATPYLAEKVSEAQTATIRQRISQILFQFYIGVATNGIYDALKLLIIFLRTFFAAGEDESGELKKMMKESSERFQQAFDSLPRGVAEKFLSEADSIDEFRKNYQQKIREALLNDEALEPLFEEQIGDFVSLYIAQSFEEMFYEA